MKRGLFITLEGPDGSGKSTQIEFLKAYFQERNLPCVFTREPGGTAIGEKLRNIILDKENQEMCDMAEALLYAAARAQHVQHVCICNPNCPNPRCSQVHRRRRAKPAGSNYQYFAAQ